MSKITMSRTAFVLLAGVAIASCSASYPTRPTKANPVALYVAYSAPRGRVPLGTFAGYGFVAYAVDADGAFERVTERVVWTTSDEDIVRAQAGVSNAVKMFMAVAPGNAQVIARLQGLEASAPVLVVQSEMLQRLPRVDLNPSGNAPAVIGATARGIATLRLSNGTSQDVSNRATWTSSDPIVATVNESGTITALGRGTTIITANADGLVDWFWFSVLPGS